MATAKRPVPEGYHTVTAHLTIENCKSALAWYVKALGAEEVSRHLGPDGNIMHAEIRIGDTRLMANDPMMGGKGPSGLGGSPVGFWIYTDNCDALFKRAVGAGGTSLRAVEDQFWGDRCGTLKDPYGYAWTIATRKEDLTDKELEHRAAEFFKQMAHSGQGNR